MRGHWYKTTVMLTMVLMLAGCGGNGAEAQQAEQTEQVEQTEQTLEQVLEEHFLAAEDLVSLQDVCRRAEKAVVPRFEIEIFVFHISLSPE